MYPLILYPAIQSSRGLYIHLLVSSIISDLCVDIYDVTEPKRDQNTQEKNNQLTSNSETEKWLFCEDTQILVYYALIDVSLENIFLCIHVWFIFVCIFRFYKINVVKWSDKYSRAPPGSAVPNLADECGKQVNRLDSHQVVNKSYYERSAPYFSRMPCEQWSSLTWLSD